jgi:hypothetical protein
MRWQAKNYQRGDRRRRIRFALIPVKIHNTWIWLEKYYSIQSYSYGWGWQFDYRELYQK